MAKKIQIQVEENVWRELNRQKEAGDTMSTVIERNIARSENETNNK